MSVKIVNGNSNSLRHGTKKIFLALTNDNIFLALTNDKIFLALTNDKIDFFLHMNKTKLQIPYPF